MNYDDLIVNTGYLFLIVNTLLFILSYNSKEKEFKYFIMYLILCSIIQLYSSYLYNSGTNNLYLSHYFFTGQFIFLNLFFLQIFHLKKLKKIILFTTVTLPLCFIIYFYNYDKAYRKWSQLEIALTSIPLLIYSFYFFIKKIDDNKDKKYIYFNSGFFVYTLCSTLLFILGNIGRREVKQFVWDINQFLYLIFQFLIFIEWYKNFRKPILLKKRS
ncbi:hypothetical protein BTO07_09955 [Polaribacter sp. SA4-12]|nr:hypothetical protein BTO07_09955 [Polaribacter sp. SA4-12]